MNREQKAATVTAIVEQIEAAEAIFAVDYRGISVPQAAALRARLRDADATFRIVKNSLTERAADQAGAPELRELLDGPTALTFVRGDMAVAAKALADLAKADVPIEFKGGLMGGEALSIESIQALARLPSRDVLYGQVVGVVAAPLNGLVRGLNALISGLALQLGQIAEQGLVGGASHPEQAEAAAEPAEEQAAVEPSEEAESKTELEADASAAVEETDGDEPAEEGQGDDAEEEA